MFLFSRFLLLGLALLSLSIRAEEIDDPYELPSSIQLQGGRDDASGSFIEFGADLAVRGEDLVSVGGSASQIKDPNTGISLRTSGFSIGYAFHPESEWSLTPAISIWGARANLMTRSVLLDYTRNLETWSFGFQPELKSLTWGSSDDLKVKKRTGALGLHLHAEYYGLRDWSFQLQVGGFNYGGQRFEHFLDSYVVTDAAMSQSLSLVKNYGGLGLSYHYGAWALNLAVQRATYLINGTVGNLFKAGLYWRFQNDWTLGYDFSQSHIVASPTIKSNALSLSYSW